MEELPISVVQTGDNTFAIEWDEKHPATMLLNDWTNEDFHEAIRIGLQELTLDKRDDVTA